MITDIRSRRKNFSCRILSCFIAVSFAFNLVLPPGYAQLVPQTLLNLPAPGTMVTASAAFTPALISGITIHPEHPLEFDFIIGTGDDRLEGGAFEEESKRLIKYFLAALTVPEDQMWVNLSPYEKDRIVPREFGVTEMGRDLLAQDYILKQLTASLMYPEKELGKKFWDEIYRRAREQYGTTEIPVNTFNKVWIVPEKAIVYEHGRSAFVVKSRMKVMLESDYEAAKYLEDGKSKAGGGRFADNHAPDFELQSSIIKEIIVPAIEREVNEGKSFANLRQIYNAVILAAWFKQNLRQTLLGQVYVDKAMTKGVDLQDKTVNEKIYAQYLEAFKKGVYNYIKEDYDPATRDVIPRKYFSGGTNLKVGDLVETYRAGGEMTRPQQEIVGAYLAGMKEYNHGRVNVNLVEVSENMPVGEAERLLASSSPAAVMQFLPEEMGRGINGWFFTRQFHFRLNVITDNKEKENLRIAKSIGGLIETLKSFEGTYYDFYEGMKAVNGKGGYFEPVWQKDLASYRSRILNLLYEEVTTKLILQRINYAQKIADEVKSQIEQKSDLKTVMEKAGVQIEDGEIVNISTKIDGLVDLARRVTNFNFRAEVEGMQLRESMFQRGLGRGGEQRLVSIYSPRIILRSDINRPEEDDVAEEGREDADKEKMDVEVGIPPLVFPEISSEEIDRVVGMVKDHYGTGLSDEGKRELRRFLAKEITQPSYETLPTRGEEPASEGRHLVVSVWLAAKYHLSASGMRGAFEYFATGKDRNFYDMTQYDADRRTIGVRTQKEILADGERFLSALSGGAVPAASSPAAGEKKRIIVVTDSIPEAGKKSYEFYKRKVFDSGSTIIEAGTEEEARRLLTQLGPKNAAAIARYKGGEISEEVVLPHPLVEKVKEESRANPVVGSFVRAMEASYYRMIQWFLPVYLEGLKGKGEEEVRGILEGIDEMAGYLREIGVPVETPRDDIEGYVREVIEKEMRETIYGPILDKLNEIAALQAKGEINPSVVGLDEHFKLDVKEGLKKAGLFFWAQKADPMQAGHLQMMLNAIVNHKISKMIPLVDNSAPGIKEGLSSIHLREPVIRMLFETLGVEPLMTYLPIMKNEDYLLDKTGEVAFFYLLEKLIRNPDNQAVLDSLEELSVGYGAGGDHFQWEKSNGKADTAKLIYDQLAAILGNENHVLYPYFKFGKLKIQMEFSMRPQDKLPENLSFIKDQFAALTDKDGKPIVQIGYSKQLANISSTRIREKNFYWEVFYPLYQMIQGARFPRWGGYDLSADEATAQEALSQEMRAAVEAALAAQEFAGVEEAVRAGIEKATMDGLNQFDLYLNALLLGNKAKGINALPSGPARQTVERLRQLVSARGYSIARGAIRSIFPVGRKDMGREPPMAGEFLLIERFLRDASRASSPAVELVNKKVSDLMKTEVRGALATLRHGYKVPYGAWGDDSAFLPHILLGFDGRENRMGWQPEALQEILRNPQWISAVVDDARDIRDNFKHVVFIGMGGSGLSVDVVESVFAAPGAPDIHSLRHTSPAAIKALVDDLAARYGGSVKEALRATKFVYITKSRTTAETLAHKDYFQELFSVEGVYAEGDMDRELPKHFMMVADMDIDPGRGPAQVTEKERTGLKPAELEAMERGFARRNIQLDGGKDIGGRFTAPSTMVFLLPLALMRPDADYIRRFLQRAVDINNVPLAEDTYARLGAYLFIMAKEFGLRNVTIIVPWELRKLPLWLQQLAEESLGKEGKGITIIYDEDWTPKALKSLAGSRRQFLRFNLEGAWTAEALNRAIEENGLSVFDIDLDSLDDLGAVMLGLERAVAVMGHLWGIRYVDQPGVEGYKKRTTAERDLMKVRGVKEIGFDDWGTPATQDRIDVYYKPYLSVASLATREQLEWRMEAMGAGMNDAAAVLAALHIIAQEQAESEPSKGVFDVAQMALYGILTPQVGQVLKNFRTRVYTERGIPSKLSEAPDYLHSYQQNLKAGFAQFFSLIFYATQADQPASLAFDPLLLGQQFKGASNDLLNPEKGASHGRKVVPVVIRGNLADPATVEDLGKFLNRVEKYLSAASSPAEAREYIDILRDNPDENKRVEAAREMGRIRPATETIINALGLALTRKGETEDVRQAAARALKEIMHAPGGGPAGRILVNALYSPDQQVRKAAAEAWASSPAGAETRALEPSSRDVKFGTSGDRGIIDGDFDLPLIRKLAQATALYAAESYPDKATLIGRDTRRKNPEFQRETAAIYAANGRPVIVIEDAPVPTPVMAFLTGSNPEIGGAVTLTASHSPYTDGGFKFAPEHGGAADEETTSRIQALANGARDYQIMDYEEAKRQGLIKVMTAREAVEQYVQGYLMPILRETGALADIAQYIKSHPDFELVLDPMQGAGVQVMRALYTAIAAEAGREFFIIINDNNNDPEFKDVNGAPQPDKSTSNGKLIQKVQERQGRFGLSVDGDADRFGTVDFGGAFFGANDLIALLAFFLKKDIGLDGAIGKTVATSDFVNAVADYLGAELDEEKVGFKWFVRNIINGRRYLIAGEESAHVGVGPFMRTFDDGFAVGLTTLWMVAKSNMSLAEYKDRVEAAIGKRFLAQPGTIRRKDIDARQGAINIVRQVNAELAQGKPAGGVTFAIQIERKTGLRTVRVLTLDGVKLFFEGGNASALLRPSGTEPAGKPYTFMAFPYDATLDQEKLKQLYRAVEDILFEASPSVSSPLDEKGSLYDDGDGDIIMDEITGASPVVVLLAEDDEYMRGDYARALTQKGYTVIAVKDGAEALKAYREKRPDIVLTDYDMPHQNGPAWIEAIKKESGGNTPPVLMMSASIDHEKKATAAKLGVPLYLKMQDKTDLKQIAGTLQEMLPKSAADGVTDDAAGRGSSPAKGEGKGGIDLNPALLDLQIKRDKNGVPLPLPQQPLHEMRIDGFIPVIINITPVTNLPMLLGLADTEDPDAQEDEARPEMKVRRTEELSALN